MLAAVKVPIVLSANSCQRGFLLAINCGIVCLSIFRPSRQQYWISAFNHGTNAQYAVSRPTELASASLHLYLHRICICICTKAIASLPINYPTSE